MDERAGAEKVGSEMQSKNEYFPIVVTRGALTEMRFGQAWNAESPMLVTPGAEKVLSDVHA